MLFNSVEYLLFLPIVFFLYWIVFKNRKWQNLFLVVVSYIFYGWWNWHFLILIAFTTLCSYLSGLLIERYREHFKTCKIVCSANIVLNVGILCVYKYYDFFVFSFADAFHHIGIDLNVKSLGLILPVGISFYTFQALSYTIDVYNKKIRAANDIVEFFAFISFFPQLVAGPIERAQNLLPQFHSKRHFNYQNAVDGMRQILWGTFKKMVIADNISTDVNFIFDNYQTQSSALLLTGGILFSFQIYCDFSGYSDIAIGSAKLLGIRLMRNFNVPYFSRNIAEFWRRWHISLTTWFRDYIYIPLGGSRCSIVKVMRNTMIIFLVSGLWHGANWTFVFWGFFHALLFFPLLLLGKNRTYRNTVAEDRLFPSATEFFQMLITFFLAMLGWVVFRSDSIHDAFSYLWLMFTNGSLEGIGLLIIDMKFILPLIIIEWLTRTQSHGFCLDVIPAFRNYRIIRWSIYLVTFLTILIFSGKQGEFIYFQF